MLLAASGALEIAVMMTEGRGVLDDDTCARNGGYCAAIRGQKRVYRAGFQRVLSVGIAEDGEQRARCG